MTGEELHHNLRQRSPRYIASGMDPNDIERLITSVSDWSEWLDRTSAFALERLKLGHEALAMRRNVSAAEHFVGAAIYFHFAQLGYFEDEAKKREIAGRARDAHQLAFDLLEPPVLQLRIPFRGVDMVANVRIPYGGPKAAAVILLPGVDSTKEEMITFETVFHKRGLATVAFEGPGQGETGERLPLVEDYEVAVSVLIDALALVPGIDGKRLGIYGRSMGGYLAPRVAATEPRIKAVASSGGPFDLRGWDQFSEQLKRFFCHAWGISDLQEGTERASRVSLKEFIPRIKCPFLILHGDADRIFAGDEGRRMAEIATSETTVVIYPEGEHVNDNIPYKYRPVTADWFAEALM
ncbi:MAG: alpha/beta hydrolase [Trueperaceae bacterium]